MKPLKEKISITIDNDILKKLRELAEADDRSLSQYINLILREHIKTVDKDLQDIDWMKNRRALCRQTKGSPVFLYWICFLLPPRITKRRFPWDLRFGKEEELNGHAVFAALTQTAKTEWSWILLTLEKDAYFDRISGWGSAPAGVGFKLCKPGTQKRKFSKYIQLDVDRLGEVCYDIPHIRPIVPCRLQRSGALCESLNILRANYYKSSCMGVRKWRPP